jgi:hypothetical protein
MTYENNLIKKIKERRQSSLQKRANLDNSHSLLEQINSPIGYSRVMTSRSNNATYGTLYRTIQEMNDVQKRFEQLVRDESSPVYHALTGLKLFIKRKVLGKTTKPITIDQLFEVQLKNVTKLNYTLSKIIEESQQDLAVLEKKVDEVYLNSEKNFHDRKEIREILPSKIVQYRELKAKFKSMQKSNAEYFKIQARLRNIQRDISRLEHEYILINDKDIHNINEDHYLANMEMLFRTTLYTAERIKEKTRLINDTLWKTKRSYQIIDGVIRITAAVSEGVENLASYTREIHNTLVEGVQEMCSIIDTDSNLNNLVGSNSEKLTNLLEDLRLTNYAIDRRNEMLIE